MRRQWLPTDSSTFYSLPSNIIFVSANFLRAKRNIICTSRKHNSPSITKIPSAIHPKTKRERERRREPCGGKTVQSRVRKAEQKKEGVIERAEERWGRSFRGIYELPRLFLRQWYFVFRALTTRGRDQGVQRHTDPFLGLKTMMSRCPRRPVLPWRTWRHPLPGSRTCGWMGAPATVCSLDAGRNLSSSWNLPGRKL